MHTFQHAQVPASGTSNTANCLDNKHVCTSALNPHNWPQRRGWSIDSLFHHPMVTKSTSLICSCFCLCIEFAPRVSPKDLHMPFCTTLGCQQGKSLAIPRSVVRFVYGHIRAASLCYPDRLSVQYLFAWSSCIAQSLRTMAHWLTFNKVLVLVHLLQLLSWEVHT